MLLALCFLAAAVQLSPQTKQEAELEIRVWEIKRETAKQRDLIRIRAEVVNRSGRPLYIEVCCGWKDIPARFHNPWVEQLDKKGDWIFVGGAYQHIPGGLYELKSGALLQSEVYVVHPCSALSVHCRGVKKYPFEIPVHGKHRITLRYFYSRDDFKALIEFRSQTKPPRAISKTFEIRFPESK